MPDSFDDDHDGHDVDPMYDPDDENIRIGWRCNDCHVDKLDVKVTRARDDLTKVDPADLVAWLATWEPYDLGLLLDDLDEWKAAIDADSIDDAQVDVEIPAEVVAGIDRDAALAALAEVRAEPEISCAHCDGVPDGTLTIQLDGHAVREHRICERDAEKVLRWL